MTRVALVASALAACTAATPAVPPPTTPAPYTQIELATEHGLSGLALDDRGALWTVAERAARAYRIELDGATPRLAAFAIDGLDPAFDLEGIAWLGGERFAFGTEGKQAGIATVLLGQRSGDRIAITGTIALPSPRVGIALPPNHGAEGVCGDGDTIVVAIEGAGSTAGRRWAPIVRIERGAIVRTHRLALTTQTGKLSALDCTIDASGRVQAWAIERHFEVTKILAFELPASGPDATAIEPRVARDLGAAIGGRQNLEGVARRRDGTTYAVVDNQWKTIQGPSALLVFAPGAVP